MDHVTTASLFVVVIVILACAKVISILARNDTTKISFRGLGIEVNIHSEKRGTKNDQNQEALDE